MTKDVLIPDLGGVDAAKVIEIHVKPGDNVEIDDSLITLESDKASMDVPAPFAGKIKEIKIKIDDEVGEGTLIATMEGEGSDSEAASDDERLPRSEAARNDESESETKKIDNNNSEEIIYASPAVRRAASEKNIDLNNIEGSGRKGRILKEDLVNISENKNTGTNLDILPPPVVEFTKFGEVERKPLSRINKISAANLHRNWVTIPHVTQFDEADITDLEAFRARHKKEAEIQGFKLTPLVFLMRAAAAALKKYPKFNSSLSNDGEELIMKKYFHIGVAVDTPNGLVVPVIRDVDKKSLFELAAELGEVSKKAREGKLTPAQMQGSCFTISSLGGIGGTYFTPIVNLPDVAIMGVSKSQMKPVYQEGEFVPRLMLPVSLSYDHRVIDGAEAARFITYFSKILSDISQILL